MNTNTQKTKGLKVKTNVKAGGIGLNHNETMIVDEQAAQLTDLEANSDLVDLEPTDDVIGGTGTFRLTFNGQLTTAAVKVYDARTGTE